MREKQHIELIQSEIKQLNASLETLKLSVVKCQLIGSKDFYSFEEQESFDSLTSKFSRTSDIFTQKVLRTTWILLHEAFLPFIDFVNVAEKIGLIESADSLLIIRDVRNQIAHEYIPEIIFDLIPEVINLTNQLELNILACTQFLQKRNWL